MLYKSIPFHKCQSLHSSSLRVSLDESQVADLLQKLFSVTSSTLQPPSVTLSGIIVWMHSEFTQNGGGQYTRPNSNRFRKLIGFKFKGFIKSSVGSTAGRLLRAKLVLKMACCIESKGGSIQTLHPGISFGMN